jgi:PAS domain S-box-containing protein
MAESDPSQRAAAELSRRAEAVWQQQPARSSLTPDDTNRLLHELGVHQIDLEMLNAELRRAQDELADSRARYFDLFDLAPVGYVTVDAKGRIVEANLAAAQLLGVGRSRLVKQPLIKLIHRDDRDIYYLHHKRLSATQRAEECELRLQSRDGAERWLRLQSVLVRDGKGLEESRVTLSDITERKQAESEAQSQREAALRAAEQREAALNALRSSQEELRAYARRLVEAIENERRNLARELHDQAAQSMSAVKLGLGRLRREVDGGGQHSERFAEMEQLVEGVMDDLHRLAMALRPVSLDRYGLHVAMQQYVDVFRQQSGLDVDLLSVGIEQQRLPNDVETAVYRVVQEALTNVYRHAQAHHVGVVLERRDKRVLAIIEDDGLGFDMDEALHRGRLGLLGMRERAEVLGGSLTVESKLGEGTTVYLEVPVGEP